MIRFILMSVALISAEPASAREWADVAGWSIVQLEDGCGLHNEFEGPGDTELMIILNRDDDDVVLGITNGNWSSVDEQLYPDIEYDTSTVTYSGGKAVGYASNGKKGFVTRFDVGFAAAIVKSSYLHIRRGDVFIDKLDLAGSGAALARVRTCLGMLKAEKRRTDAANAAEQRRYAGIERDPFAASHASGSAKGATRAILRLGSVSANDYPPAAIRAGEQGQSIATYTVGTDGRVGSCSSSGAGPILDAETCDIIQRRFRFAPARDGSGNPIVETKTQAIRWTLPVQAAPSPTG